MPGMCIFISQILLLSLQSPISTPALICNSKGLFSDEIAG